MSEARAPFIRVGRALAIAVLLTAGVTSAQSDDDIARARALFERAELLRQNGEYALAAEKLRAAIAVKETPGLRFHLAHALEQDGQLIAARREYQRAEQLIAQGHAAEDVRELLGPALSHLDEVTPTLEVKLPEGFSDVRVTIDGARVRTRAKHPVDPGRRTVVVRVPEREPVTTVVVLAPGERKLVEPEIPPAAVVTESSSSEFPLREVVLASEGGLAAVALGFGVLQTVAAANADDEVAEQQARLQQMDPNRTDTCFRLSPRPGACGDLEVAIEDRDQARRLAILGYAVAGAGALSLIGTLLFWPSRSPEADARAQHGPAPGTRLGAASIPGGMFATVSGGF